MIVRYGTRGEASGPRSIGALSGQLLRPLQDQHSTQLTLQHPSPAPKIRASSRYWPRAVGPLRRPSFSRLSCTDLTSEPYCRNISKAGGSFSVAAKPVPSLSFFFKLLTITSLCCPRLSRVSSPLPTRPNPSLSRRCLNPSFDFRARRFLSSHPSSSTELAPRPSSLRLFSLRPAPHAACSTAALTRKRHDESLAAHHQLA